jgi:NAD(P)-dependent dehydrogenase (short-subunit alcohol dehydrogenase family)
LPYLNDQGHIINVSSGTTRFANPGYSVYASAKSAIETFTRYLAKEIGAKGITANVLAPGAIETDFNEAAIRNNPRVKGYRKLRYVELDRLMILAELSLFCVRMMLNGLMDNGLKLVVECFFKIDKLQKG